MNREECGRRMKEGRGGGRGGGEGGGYRYVRTYMLNRIGYDTSFAQENS